jgi:hypothetical protein
LLDFIFLMRICIYGIDWRMKIWLTSIGWRKSRTWGFKVFDNILFIFFIPISAIFHLFSHKYERFLRFEDIVIVQHIGFWFALAKKFVRILFDRQSDSIVKMRLFWILIVVVINDNIAQFDECDVCWLLIGCIIKKRCGCDVR